MNTRRVNRIEDLAQSIPPTRDLWPAIAAAIEVDQAAGGAAVARANRSRWLPAIGMAAAVALVALGVVIGQWMAPTKVIVASQPGNAAIQPAALREANYLEERKVLVEQVNQRLAAMPKADREKVAASLATLQRSISEIRAALGRDPANALLQELLVNSCQEEMRALTAVRDSGRQEI